MIYVSYPRRTWKKWCHSLQYRLIVLINPLNGRWRHKYYKYQIFIGFLRLNALIIESCGNKNSMYQLLFH